LRRPAGRRVKSTKIELIKRVLAIRLVLLLLCRRHSGRGELNRHTRLGKSAEMANRFPRDNLSLILPVAERFTKEDKQWLRIGTTFAQFDIHP
jgi:hypothetical protein